MYAGAIAFALVLLVPAAGAGAVTTLIDFEKIPAPPTGGGGEPVNAQYEDVGVLFNDPPAWNYELGTEAIPGFAHSGSIAVETPCFAIEFCQAPVQATITQPQTRASVWVGVSFTLMEPLVVRLQAFDGAGNVVEEATTELQPSSGPIPIDHQLEVVTATPEIVRIEVDVPDTSGGGGYTSGLAVDDVEFESPDPEPPPPPPCNATSVPQISLSRPLDGTVTQHNGFLLQGTAGNGGAPIRTAAVLASSPSGTLVGRAYPSLIDADGGSFAVSYNGILVPGPNEVTVTATNCLGTGTSSARTVTWAALANGTFFRQLGVIEVVQAVQNPANGVPLVAAAPDGSTKRTWARLYLDLEGPQQLVHNVSAYLRAYKPDGTPLGASTLEVRSANSIIITDNTLERARSSLEHGLYFELPRSWLAEGQIHLEVDRILVGGEPTDACVGCANAAPGGGRALVRFHPARPMDIWLIRYPYKLADGTVVRPRLEDVTFLTSWIRRAYPSSDIQIVPLIFPPVAKKPTCTEVNTALASAFSSFPGADPDTKYYALVGDGGKDSGFMRGCAVIGGQFASGPAGQLWPFDKSGHWDRDGSYADWYGGHELGHTYNRLHPGFCNNNSSDDGTFPYPGGLIGDTTFDNQGWDSGEYGLGIRRQIYDWRDGWSDVMTYCADEWISPYTYTGILADICGDPMCPDGVSVSRPATRRAKGRRLAVNGTIDLGSGELELERLTALRNLTLTEREGRGDYAIVLRGAGGAILARYRFEPPELSDLPEQKATAVINEVVPFARGTRRVVIEHEGTELASVAVSANAPRVRIRRPKGGTLDAPTKVRWRGRDRDGDRLTYSLYYSHDGQTWIPLASELRRRSFRVDPGSLPGGEQARFKVVATDGVLGTSRRSKPVSVAVKPPIVSIAAPEDGTSVTEEEPLQLVATVEDLQDPDFPDEGIVWSSSVQGELGAGASIVVELEPGTHEITVEATNSGGASAASPPVTVIVTDVPPDFDADAVPAP